MCHSCHSFCVVVVGGSDVGVVYIVAGVAVVAGGVVMVIFVVEANEKNVKAGKGRTVDFSFELTEAAKNDSQSHNTTTNSHNNTVQICMWQTIWGFVVFC